MTEFWDIPWNWVFSVMAAIMLFLHGLTAFSDEITRLGGERMRQFLAHVTRRDWVAALMGGLATVVIQSSSAITSMAVGLAHNQTLSPRGAMAVMIGANVGTTLTAWLVAFKVSGLGPVFLTIGGLWSLAGPRPWRSWGKPLFYFGLIFLALDLISQALTPLSQHPDLPYWQTQLQQPVLALVFGVVLTALVQSSSVGTTSTALLASTSLSALARRLAWVNTAFKVLGVLLFATVLQPVIGLILASGLNPAEQVALVHTVFNVAAAAAALLMMPPLWPHVDPWLHRLP
ncbi:MAG: Na/Pi cotransporter family protein [Aquabacterium sp.]